MISESRWSAAITGTSIEVIDCDITEAGAIAPALRPFAPEAVIHFAGLKAVGEAVEMPLEYYRVNVAGSLALFREMAEIGCNRLVFSSSATVYGDPRQVPIPEDHPLQPTNPYGQSKRMVEQIVEDWGRAAPDLAAVNLRYFNPVGAHPSARIGEAPDGTPNNLMPFVAQVAAGWREHLSVFGDDYDTPDGTGVRDYIHVVDLAEAHVAALDALRNGRLSGATPVNVGTGNGSSVLDVIKAASAAVGRDLPYEIVPRRSGDIAMTWAATDYAACVGAPTTRVGTRCRRSCTEPNGTAMSLSSGVANR